MSVLFFEPIFKSKIWGGCNIKKNFNYNLEDDNIGECWGISAHNSGDSIISNGNFKGYSLSYIWDNCRYLFGNASENTFPLMTKLIDSNDDLSIQVHPDNCFAKEHENGELGKTECWYILDAKDDARIILGHNSQSKSDFVNKVNHKEWNTLLNSLPIKKGDFYYVPAGTVHALCKGALVLEVQQNSDTTYRLYDYDRIDSDGNLRELHVEKSLSVINIPHIKQNFNFDSYICESFDCTTYIQDNFFSVYKLNIESKSDFVHKNPFTLFNVVNGSGKLHLDGISYDIFKGYNFILLNDVCDFSLDGKLEIIISHT